MINARIKKIWSATTPMACPLWDPFSKRIFGAASEKPKVVISTSSTSTFCKLAVHIAPMGATIALFFFNFVGYFVGCTLAGPIQAMAQSMDRLALQLTAKLYELFVIMSLGVIISDEVREKLLFERHGLPLGLLLSHKQFSDVAFLQSSEFRAGWRGIKEWRERHLFGILIVTCSLVALLIGPSSALLMIPTWHTDWPAGGATFWLNGDLSPTQLSNSSILNDRCFATNSSVLDSMDWAYASCPWAGYPFLKRYFEQPSLGANHRIGYNYHTFEQNLDVQWADGLDLVFAYAGVRSWVVASNIAVAAFSRHIASLNWSKALFKAIPETSIRSQYAFRQPNGTTGAVGGRVPAVRIQCMKTGSQALEVPLNATTAGGQLIPFPIIPDFAICQPQSYVIPVPLWNVSYTAAQWVNIPSTPTTTSQGFNISHYPSAFLLIRNPPHHDTDISCSVQVDWVPGTHITSQITYQLMTSQQATVEAEGLTRLQNWVRKEHKCSEQDIQKSQPVFEKPSTWEHLSLSTSWLDVLTPSLYPNDPEKKGATTLASVLENVLNHIETLERAPVIDYTAAEFEKITTVVATFVADGLSRLGWDENHASELGRHTVSSTEIGSNSSNPGWNYGKSDWHDVFPAIINRHASLQPNEPYRETVGRNYTLRIAIEGYGMIMNGVSYDLAVAVLSVYVCLVVYHLHFVFRKDRKSHGSARWSSLVDMLVLAQVSNPPERDALMNTCAGVETHATLKLPVKIRAMSRKNVEGEDLQLLVDSDAGREVVAAEEYGSL